MRLKTDLFGTVTRRDTSVDGAAQFRVERDARAATWWLRWLAIGLARREAKALQALNTIRGVPSLLAYDDGCLQRSWIEGAAMQHAKPRDRAYFRDGLRLLRQLHRAGVVHNDLAKEPNWLVDSSGAPALVDFQLAWVSRRRGKLFRLLAREDLRHLLKHKRSYCPQCLTTRQRRLLAEPGAISRIWMLSGKKLYLFITRRLLGWADREGAGDRRWDS